MTATAAIEYSGNNTYLTKLNVTVMSTFNKSRVVMNFTCQIDDGINTAVVATYEIVGISCKNINDSNIIGNTTDPSGQGKFKIKLITQCE